MINQRKKKEYLKKHILLLPGNHNLFQTNISFYLYIIIVNLFEMNIYKVNFSLEIIKF